MIVSVLTSQLSDENKNAPDTILLRSDGPPMRTRANSPSRFHLSGTRNRDILNFLISQVTVPNGSGGRRRRGNPSRILKRKLTESARESPKSFRLAEPVRVAPGDARSTTRPHHSPIPHARICLTDQASCRRICITMMHR